MHRPWGEFSWLRGKLKFCENDWKFIGCLSSEIRSIAIVEHLTVAERNNLSFIEVLSSASNYDSAVKELRKSNKERLKTLYNLDCVYRSFELVDSFLEIKKSINEMIHGYSHIVLDISCFPKRYFFFLTKHILEAEHVESLVITYTEGESYPEGNISDDFRPANTLPFFLKERFDVRNEIIVSGVGLSSFNQGLQPIVNSYSPLEKISFLFPFPPGPPLVMKHWDFIRNATENIGIKSNEVKRVHALDVSKCFDEIVKITENGQYQAVFAPLGPKTHSLAMCLYTIKFPSDVVYSQPLSYNPLYTEGVKRKFGMPDTMAYLIKNNFTNIY